MEDITFQKQLGDDYHAQYTEYLSSCAELRAVVGNSTIEQEDEA